MPQEAGGIMYGQSDSNDYQPFGYLGRVPLYVTTLLVMVYAGVMVMLALLAAGGMGGLGLQLAFGTEDVRHHYQFWELLSYALVNGPSLWFAIEMYMLYAFGREVERFIGRKSFAMMYLTVVLLGPLLLTAVATVTGGRYFLAGSQTPNFAVFAAFCTIYPNAEIFFRLKAKWVAAILLGIAGLQLLAAREIVELLVLAGTVLAAFLFIKYLRGEISGFSLGEYLRRRRSQRSLRPMSEPVRRGGAAKPNRGEKEEVIESIDPLLDKIAKHGLGSLTAAERARLEEAREELLKKPLP